MTANFSGVQKFRNLKVMAFNFCRHLTRLHKDDAADAKKIGPRSGIGAFATVDIYRSSMVSTIPGRI